MITITRKLEFDAGHRVLGHEGKCANLHGHRYVAELTATASGLDKIGRVIDFSVLRTLVGGWIDEHWDHNMLLNSKDPLLLCYQYPLAMLKHETNTRAGQVLGPKAPYVFMDMNPTAEVMATVLLKKAQELLTPHGLTVAKVRLYETPNCWADTSMTWGQDYMDAQDRALDNGTPPDLL